jgi:ferric-dicitrate binding protein FerR (iron transport regulator)
MNKAGAMPRPKPQSRRRRYAPLILAIGLAALIWLFIVLGGAALRVWLA